LTVAEKAPGRKLLRRELGQFVFKCVAGSDWRRLAAMTTSSSRRRSPCWRQISQPSMLL
jgi:hypothetical protein